jgi:hypothetical protein
LGQGHQRMHEEVDRDRQCNCQYWRHNQSQSIVGMWRTNERREKGQWLFLLVT